MSAFSCFFVTRAKRAKVYRFATRLFFDRFFCFSNVFRVNGFYLLRLKVIWAYKGIIAAEKQFGTVNIRFNGGPHFSAEGRFINVLTAF